MIARRSLSRVLVSLCVVVGGLLFVWSAPALAQRMHAFGSSFGGEGSGNGQLSRPGVLAVNEETGDVYVVDRGNGRVEIFSAAGEYVGQFNGSAAPTGPFFWPETPNKELYEEAEGSIAVDNSTNPLDPSKGDVYVVNGGEGGQSAGGDPAHEVVDKFSASGAYLGQVTLPKLEIGQNSEVVGVAVDPNGGLWVLDGEGYVVDQFSDAAPVNEYVSSVSLKAPKEGVNPDTLGRAGLARDAEGNLYIAWKALLSATPSLRFPIEFSKAGEALVERLDHEETSGFAVDQSSGDVYVDHETSVAAYAPSETSIEQFGSPQLQASQGIAVNSATGTVYAANAASQEIDVFPAFVVPDVSTGAVSNLAETSVTVGGVVNPDGLPVTACEFEYGPTTAYGQSEPCSPNPSGSSPVAVSAELKGLERLTRYHFRLRVANANGADVGQDHTFLTPEPVALSEEAVSDVSSASALFSVQVDPGGADTTYTFEYGTSVAYGASVPAPAGDLGPGTSSEPVSARVEGLLGETTYHVRVVASNLFGAVYGPDQTFTTQAAGGAFVLPDGRAWELVSPPNKSGAKLFELGGGEKGSSLVQASADGGAISYTASGPMGANVVGSTPPFGNAQVLSRRGAGGWSSEDISLSHPAAGEAAEDEYTFFSSDLSRGIVTPWGAGLYSPEATEETPYIRDTESGSYLPLVTAGDVPPGVKFGPPKSPEDPMALAVTPDFSHVLVGSPVALTSNAVYAGSAMNLYEWSGGGLQLVNELPDHTVSKGGAGLGGTDFATVPGRNTRNAFSRDGSRVFFQISPGAAPFGYGALYLRDTVTGQTVEVDAPAQGVPSPPVNAADFQIASADGSKVFFLDWEPLTPDSKLTPTPSSEYGPTDLYVYETGTGSLTDLTVDPNAGEAAQVKEKVVGASEDGSVVYFVAEGKLAEGAQSGQDNLYVESQTGSSWSSPRLVAVLSEEDKRDWTFDTVHALSSRVSASGRYLTFMSDVSLTGYDNRDAVSGVPDEEVFLYDRVSGALRCVSCNPTGARPDGVYDGLNFIDPQGVWAGRWLAGSIPGWTEPLEGSNDSIAYQSRVLSDEGRMFFDSADALVPQDTNGVEDVYEYEPVGVGGSSGCTTAARTYVASEGGCVSLISSGTSGGESEFLDASENGSDVFFLTAARLVGQDVDTSYDVYDAHVCSAGAPCASVPVSPPPCSSGDSCKAAPSPQPAVFGAPSSATFSGAGNVSASEPGGSSSAPKRAIKKEHPGGKRRPKSRHRGKGKSRGRGSRARRSLSAGTRR